MYELYYGMGNIYNFILIRIINLIIIIFIFMNRINIINIKKELSDDAKNLKNSMESYWVFRNSNKIFLIFISLTIFPMFQYYMKLFLKIKIIYPLFLKIIIFIIFIFCICCFIYETYLLIIKNHEKNN